MHLLIYTWLRAKHHNTQKILLPYRFCGDSHHAFAFPFVLIFLPLRLSCKESSTSNQAFSIVFTTPSVPLVGDRNLRRKDVNRPTRCSEPLRSKVGGPSKVFAILCGMGPLGADIYLMSTFIEIAFNFLQISNSIFMYYRITTYIYKFRIAKTYIWFLYHCCSFIKQTHIFFYI